MLKVSLCLNAARDDNSTITISLVLHFKELDVCGM